MRIEYQPDTIRYYKRKTPPIIEATNGGALICSGESRNFKVTNAPPLFAWFASSNLKLSSMFGYTTTVSANGSGAGWVRVSGPTMTVQYDIWIGPPTLAAFYIAGPDYACLSGYDYYYVQMLNSKAGPLTNHSWTAYGPSSNYNLVQYGPGNAYCNAIFNTVGFWTLEVQVQNACGGWSPKYQKNIWVDWCRGASSSVYPNPVSDVLFVDLDTPEGDVKTPPAYDVRLYDGQGNLLRQQSAAGGTVWFNVSDLPDGVYYLHIYDGINDKPEMHQVVVQH